MKEWIDIALRRDILQRSLKVGGLVGTILVAINQGDLIVNGPASDLVWWKIPLTYLVPYCVSTYAGVAAVRTQQSNSQNLSGDDQL